MSSAVQQPPSKLHYCSEACGYCRATARLAATDVCREGHGSGTGLTAAYRYLGKRN